MRDFFDRQDMRRANFLSRVFGIFSEEIVRVWALDERAPYVDLGRPQLIDNGRKLAPLDFTLRHRTSLKTYVAEMKCEIAYQRFAYLTLTDPCQLDHHKKEAFAAFLAHARLPGQAMVRSVPIKTDGAILIWGDATAKGIHDVKATCGFHEILTVAQILTDLRNWQSPAWQSLTEEIKDWTGGLGDWLETG